MGLAKSLSIMNAVYVDLQCEQLSGDLQAAARRRGLRVLSLGLQVVRRIRCPKFDVG